MIACGNQIVVYGFGFDVRGKLIAAEDGFVELPVVGIRLLGYGYAVFFDTELCAAMLAKRLFYDGQSCEIARFLTSIVYGFGGFVPHGGREVIFVFVAALAFVERVAFLRARGRDYRGFVRVFVSFAASGYGDTE